VDVAQVAAGATLRGLVADLLHQDDVLWPKVNGLHNFRNEEKLCRF
jgi:hypothetical protein